MTTTRERRRNQYVGNCKVCGVECKPGEGWLYSDTSTSEARRRRRTTQKWPKFVECDRCHGLGVASRSQLPENAPKPRRKLTVADIRTGRFVCGSHRWSERGFEIPVIRLVLANGTSEIVAHEESFTGESVDVRFDEAGSYCVFDGWDLTPAARKELDRISAYAVETLDNYWHAFRRIADGE